ncbi:hypothetical protein BHE74_00017366, partial [Ensete ventricosum]
MGAVYHRGRIPSASTSESHRGDLIIQRYDWSDWRVGLLSAYIRFREPDKSEDEAELKMQQKVRRCSVCNGFDDDVEGIMGFLADVGGLYAISLAIFLFVLVQ